MTELLTSGALGLLVVSFGIGIVIGLTGMGGGALMTPALIMLGIPPAAAVSNDLVAAAVNKSVGAAVHWRNGSPHLGITLWLLIGSVPMAFAGGFIVSALGGHEESGQDVLRLIIGGALLVAATTYVLRTYLHFSRTLNLLEQGLTPDTDGHPKARPIPTLIVGAVGGLLVGITSVGSGTLIMVCLLLLYPTLSAVRMVGTDLLQAIPLVTAAAISHALTTGVDLEILIPLLVSGAPGTYLGAKLTGMVSQSVSRRGIAIVLTVTAAKMLGLPNVWVGFLGAGLLILGPLAWALLRRTLGLPTFGALNAEEMEEVALNRSSSRG
ncbi:sulfite exporter TauE/SafE family protein [Kytococcus sedentarius]|uniref:Probable membrane transporter protein n=1 Tax=Kytococcus sedentarius (strain ATCC 14392 / DSM 20547 / JCM 11482 / CCUG 33030 / NBRC 15357 / NCTC 11040 / CCM 314 / 541) TaxID=478801 RepID=C7NJV0_KYTSD|nr:sulfite exporter TauE/SafE family protein [Kytococcus sedentarius]ACV06882.1 predicted permease [Kytococcus sedentarius DSM 20547]QQB62897.1 sulfite exporter TauE/SafE family protein [Kytococcus sedentarius]STX14293.1 Sulfite exporter TauE/SafE [Kytococcus sedentarius]